MRNLLIVAGLMAVAAPSILTSPVSASAKFSLSDVFDAPAHKYIDHQCQDARKFADRAAQSTDDIASDAAISAAHAYMACYNMPRVMPDVEAERYLLISTAAALYLAGTKASDDSAARLLRTAYAFDDALTSRKGIPSAGEMDFITLSRDHAGGGKITSNSFRQPDPGVESYADVASEMEDAIVERLSQEKPKEPEAKSSP